MLRKAKAYQFDLFASPQGGGAPAPTWPTLPEATRVTLTTLLARLILDHARAPERKETGDDA